MAKQQEELAPGVSANPKERLHKASYASDKRSGGYLIRVTGPRPNMFAGRSVPVLMKSGEEHLEKLIRLVWFGSDKETGAPVALYTFEPRPRGEDKTEMF